MSSVLLILLVLSSVAVESVKLPGLCPKVPQAQEIPEKFVKQNLQLIREVPFTKDQQSYYFNQIHNSYKAVISLHYNDNEDYSLTLQYENWKNGNNLQVGSSIKIVNGSEFILLKSFMYTQLPDSLPLFCKHFIIDNVRIWFDGDVMFIWSCVNTTTSDHDEAVFVVVAGRKPDQEPWDILMSIKNISEKYLSQNLINQIDWSKKYKTLIKTDGFNCPLGINSFTTIIVFAYVGLCILIFFVISKNFKIPKQNRVLPFVT